MSVALVLQSGVRSSSFLFLFDICEKAIRVNSSLGRFSQGLLGFLDRTRPESPAILVSLNFRVSTFIRPEFLLGCNL